MIYHGMSLDSTLCREKERVTALSIFGKLLRAWAPNFRTQLQVHFLDVEGRSCVISYVNVGRAGYSVL